MKHWSAEFQPRSLCSFAGPGGDGDSAPSDGGYTGTTSGDFFGSSDGYYGTNDSGNLMGDTAPAAPAATGGDSWTGSETGASQFASSDPGSFFGNSSPGPGGDTSSGFNYSGSGSDGFIGPGSDFGYSPGDGWGPTGGVDFTSSGMGFGYGPGPDAASNFAAYSNTAGPGMGWAGDFGTYGSGGPTGTGFGQGAQSASIGGPGQYGSPSGAGINGFPGDFGAPPGGAFGMPNQGDVGPQAGPGMPGGPQTMQQGEALNPSLFGPEVTTPDRVAPTDDRTEVDPSTVFGPAVTANAGWFGPSQAQAGQNMTNQGVIDAANMANDFGRTGNDMTAYMAATNPGLAQALGQIATNFQADPANDPANYAGPSPGAQQGFTGTSAQQGTMSFDSFGGKGDSLNQSGRAETQQVNPNMDQIDPMVQQAGYQQLAQEMNAQQAQQTPTVQQDTRAADFDTRAADFKTGQQMLADQMTQLATDFGPNYGPSAPGLAQPGQLGPGMVMADPTVTPGQQQFGDAIPGTQFAAQSRGSDQALPWSQGERGSIESEMETIGRAPNEDVISSLLPASLNVGREAAPIGLWGMQNDVPAGRPGGSPAGNPTQAAQAGPFGPGSGRPGGETSGRPGLSITVGNNQYAAGRPGGPGYYQTGGAGIAPGAKGAEYGGAYGINSPGRPGTSAFGGDFRQGGGGGAYFYDPATGQYFQAGGRR